MNGRRRTIARIGLSVALALMSTIVVPCPIGAVEVGEPAPDFTLPSTSSGDISLRDFHGKKFVLLEFYGADFAPT